MSGTPYTTDQQMMGIAEAYAPERFIAPLALPIARVDEASFKYVKYREEETRTVPDTRVGRMSSPKRIQFGTDEVAGDVVDHGLTTVVPNDDVRRARSIQRLANTQAEKLTELVHKNKEVRAASFYKAESNFGYKQTLSLKKDSSVDVIKEFELFRNEMDFEPNSLVLSSQELTRLRNHPSVLEAFHGTAGVSKGLVTLEWLKEQLAVEQILVGKNKINTAKRGEDISVKNAWETGSMGLVYLDKNANFENRIATFGLTARWQSWVAGWRNVDVGLRGGREYLCGESVIELSVCKGAGTLINTQ